MKKKHNDGISNGVVISSLVIKPKAKSFFGRMQKKMYFCKLFHSKEST